MCDPASIALGTAIFEGVSAAAVTVGGAVQTAAPFLAIASTAVGAVGAVKQGQFQAAVQRRNAQEAKWQADIAIERGQQKAGARRQQGAALMAKQKVGAAAGNIDIGFGTPLDIIGDTALIAELDAQSLEQNAEYEARGYSAKAADLLAGAKNSEQSGKMAAVGTVLGGLGSFRKDFPNFFGGSGSDASGIDQDAWGRNMTVSYARDA